MKIFLLSLLCVAAPLIAEDQAEPVSVHDTKTIESNLGKHITAQGKVKEAFWVRGDVLMLTFREEEKGFIAVSFRKHREDLDKAFDGDVAKHLKGKTIRVQGKVEEYRYRPQIVVRKPSQIEIVVEKSKTTSIPRVNRLP